MKFKFDNGVARLYDNKYVNVVQPINPYNNKIFTNKEDALEWSRQYYLSMYGASKMYFEFSINNNEEAIKTDQEYTLILKESTGRLTGKYEIVVAGKNKIIEEVEFADGEGAMKITFRHADIYEILLNNEFYVGQEKYLAFVDESEDIELYSSGKKINNLTIVVE